MPYPEHRSTSLLHFVPVHDFWSSSSSGWPIVILPPNSYQMITKALQSVKLQRERRGQRRNTGRRRKWWTPYQVQFGRPWKVGRIHPRLHWRILSLSWALRGHSAGKPEPWDTADQTAEDGCMSLRGIIMVSICPPLDPHC